MNSVLFVCTGNIFRSMTAEYALKATLGTESQIAVSSAGTVAKPQRMYPAVRQRLLERGIDPEGHIQRKINHHILNAADLVIAMGFDHRDYLKQYFDYEALLFNTVCHEKEEAVSDIWEVVPDWKNNTEAAEQHATSAVDWICDSIPLLAKSVLKNKNRSLL